MSEGPIESNMFTTAHGTYKVRWRERGRNCQKTFRRKIDAVKFQGDLLKRGEMKSTGPARIKFEEFAEVWLERHCRFNVEASTSSGYEYALKKWILPFFQGLMLEDIDEDDVIKFKEQLAFKYALSPVSVGNLVRQVKLIFNCACKWKNDSKQPYLLVSPARHVKEPRKPEVDFKFWTQEEIKKFLTYTRDRAPVVYTVAALVTGTGLRRGELFQLTRECIDFENRLLTVKQSYSFTSRKPKPPKGRRIRRIPINSEVYQVLLKYHQLQSTQRIFEGVNIEHFHKHLRKWCMAAGVKDVTLHDLRDTFASSLVRAGVRIKVIQYLMGHVNISTTELYMHLDPNDLAASTDCLKTGVLPAPLEDNLYAFPKSSGGEMGAVEKMSIATN